jgi:hypothetical protein
MVAVRRGRKGMATQFNKRARHPIAGCRDRSSYNATGADTGVRPKGHDGLQTVRSAHLWITGRSPSNTHRQLPTARNRRQASGPPVNLLSYIHSRIL